MNRNPLESSPKTNFGTLISSEHPVGYGSSSTDRQDLASPFAATRPDIITYERSKRDKATPDYLVKIVVVGDGAAGKTCLLISYTQGRFPEDYVPTIFENYVTKIEGPHNKVIELALWDTAGQEEYSRLRPLSYGDVNIVMICYASNNKVSLQNAEELWYPEVRHFCPNAPRMLVGLKSDLYLGDNNQTLIDTKVADEVAKRIGAFVHVQCSSKTRQNLTHVFDTAIHTAMHQVIERKQSMGNKPHGKMLSLFGKSTDHTSDYPGKDKRRKCVIL
ncbi:HBR230Wp [Eremothecium sinecaudum]|uniref:GTP-binding protein RHO4 n=1 Tax=Eremothecium sinecaudum TaxID=45286 RepID=A0A125RE13_9SACH|nr:HBR230Wp [Eremothecium sinecaudum]AMD19131.1 HBR230Wp [Eremothecium sinecaudum]